MGSCVGCKPQGKYTRCPAWGQQEASRSLSGRVLVPFQPPVLGLSVVQSHCAGLCLHVYCNGCGANAIIHCAIITSLISLSTESNEKRLEELGCILDLRVGRRVGLPSREMHGK